VTPRDLWRTINIVLGRGRLPICPDVTADHFSDFFAEKVERIRQVIAGVRPPVFPNISSWCTAFELVTIDEALAAIGRLSDKSFTADPIPVPVLKQLSIELSIELAPYLSELFNRSMKTGHFSSSFKSAFITPRLKKAGLDAADAGSYRPISNLTVISTLLERLVCHRLFAYLQSADLLPTYQSAYRPNHSTEAANLRILSDLLQYVDQGDVAVPVVSV
jgi:hypothetical protein